MQIAPANPSDMTHPTYGVQKRDADTESLSRVEIALSNHVGGITFVNPVNTRKAHVELMNQVRNKAMDNSNKYEVQIEPLYFEWNRFIPMLVKGIPRHIK